MEKTKENSIGLKTPYFIIEKNQLDKNIDDFQRALNAIWPNSQLSYSVKTNSLPWLLKYLHSKNIYAEVVSDEEYLLAKKCGFIDSQIIFNGPIKGHDLFMDALTYGAIVNVDSKNDLKFTENAKEIYGDNIGIRINPNPEVFDRNDIGYLEDGFRFGFSDETGELENAINIVKTISDSVGLHLHCNSVTRNKAVYIALAEYATEIIKQYKLKVSYIDMGGGFFGGIPGKTTPNEYIAAIRKVLEKVIDVTNTKLFVEPGSAIIGSAVDLVTSVVDVKETSRSMIVTTDGSRIQIDPLWKKKGYLYSLETQNDERISKQIICGYTCMDHDRLMTVEDERKLSIGDRIIYHRVGAYSMTFGGMFICYYPDVYVRAVNHIEHVRDRITVNGYYNIHNNKGRNRDEYFNV